MWGAAWELAVWVVDILTDVWTPGVNERPGLSPVEQQAALQALMAVALADGVLTEAERGALLLWAHEGPGRASLASVEEAVRLARAAGEVEGLMEAAAKSLRPEQQERVYGALLRMAKLEQGASGSLRPPTAAWELFQAYARGCGWSRVKEVQVARRAAGLDR